MMQRCNSLGLITLHSVIRYIDQYRLNRPLSPELLNAKGVVAPGASPEPTRWTHHDDSRCKHVRTAAHTHTHTLTLAITQNTPTPNSAMNK